MPKATKAEVLNYRVLINKEKSGNGKLVYVTQVPTLGISDFGETFEEALRNTEKLIKFHIESLIEEGEPVPQPDDSSALIVTSTQVEIVPKGRLAFS